MMTIENLATFFGWCSVLNLAFYVLSIAALAIMPGLVTTMNTKLFQISESTFHAASMSYIARYKLAIIVLNIVPYIALRIMLVS